MSSPDSTDPKDIPSSSSSPPPPRSDIFQTLRRFSDLQVSSLLHSLIGLPSMVTPPSTQRDWILESDLPAGDPSNPRPRQQRSGSDSIVDEIKKHGGGGGGGGGSSGSAIAVPAKKSEPSKQVVGSAPNKFTEELRHAQTELDYYEAFEKQVVRNEDTARRRAVTDEAAAAADWGRSNGTG